MSASTPSDHSAATRIPREATDKAPHKAIRPKDAATLIVIDRDGDRPRILLGRRNARHVFKPGAYVFPGGRVDAADSYVPVANDYRPHDDELLTLEPRRKLTLRRRRAFGVAAIRETMEEAGLMLGLEGRGVLAGRSEWVPFDAAGLMPDLSLLAFIARAITPPGRPRRFDTRFFAAFRDGCLDASPYGHRASDELADLGWFSFDEAKALNLPGITEFVLDVLAERLERDATLEQPAAIPFFEAPRGKPATVLLSAGGT